MEIRKIIMTILACSVLLLSSALLGCGAGEPKVVEAPAPDSKTRETLGEYGNVTLAFASISDVHFSSVCDEQVKEYYPKALKKAVKETRNGLDAVVVSGDFSEGYLKDYDTLIGYTKAVVGFETPLIASYGNHEGNGKHHQYVQKFGRPVDNVTTVNGYDLIVVGAHANNTYTQEQAAWLDGQLKTMTEADPDKPVFVIVHHPVYDTHRPADGNRELENTLKKYPQAFVICGHDHAPFGDASFWQGEFISFRNSYLRNEEEGQYALIRVTDKNFVVIKKYKIRPGEQEPTYMGDDIVIDLNAFYAEKTA